MYYDQEYLAYKPIGNKVVLDFSRCKYPMDVQALLKSRFGFPEYYGNNWDALWDVLRFRWIQSDGDVSVEIHGYNKMSEPYDYYYTMYPDVSTKPLTEQEKKTAFVPITEVETRIYYSGPYSKCRNEDFVRYNHD